MNHKVKLGVTETEVTTVKDGGAYMIKRAVIIYDPHTEKGRGISQIIDGLRRVIGLKEYRGDLIGKVDPRA